MKKRLIETLHEEAIVYNTLFDKYDLNQKKIDYLFSLVDGYSFGYSSLDKLAQGVASEFDRNRMGLLVKRLIQIDKIGRNPKKNYVPSNHSSKRVERGAKRTSPRRLQID